MTIETLLKKENNNLDLFRILLALMVIFGHTSYLNGDSAYWFDPIRYLTKYTYSGAFAVKIFFFISGLVVTNSLLKKPRPAAFLIARLFRVLPGLFFVVIVTALIICPFITTLSIQSYFTSTVLYKYIIGNCLLILRIVLPGVFENNNYSNVVNGSLWSLRYEMGCYLSVVALFLLKKKWLYNGIIAIILFDALIYPHFFRDFLIHGKDTYLLPFCFATGALLAVNAATIQVSFYTTFFFFLLFILFRKTTNGEAFLIWFTCSALIQLCSNKTIIRLRPKYDISYGIYLWGFFIQQTIFYLLGHISGALHFILASAVSVIIAFISFRLIEQPFMKMGRRVAVSVEDKLKSLRNKRSIARRTI